MQKTEMKIRPNHFSDIPAYIYIDRRLFTCCFPYKIT